MIPRPLRFLLYVMAGAVLAVLAAYGFALLMLPAAVLH